MTRKREMVLDEATGLWLEKDVEFVKRERMSRAEWRAWFAIEEITEEEFKDEYSRYRRPLDI